jgi:lipopolysaccharide exporter
MSKFLSSVLKLFSATLVGQVLGILVTPVLSRLYSPADFGLFQVFLSIISVIAVISCLSYESAIVLPEKNEDAANLVSLCLFLIGTTSIIVSVFFILFSEVIEQLFNAPALSQYIFLIPLGIICNSIAFVLSYWMTRREEYGTMAKANITSSFTSRSVSIGFGVYSPSPFGLIFGTIINDATIICILLKKTVSDLRFFRMISLKKVKELAIRYKKFPKYNIGSELASSLSIQVTPLLLAVFFSPVIVGYYAMSYLVIRLPSKVIGNSIATVFFQKASEEKNRTGSVKNIVKSVNARLISVGILPTILLIIIGPELFTFALGTRWENAGVYAQILAPVFFVAFISVPILSIFNVMEQQRISLWFNVWNLFYTVIVLIIAGTLNDPLLGFILLSCIGVLSWSWMNLYSLKLAGVPSRAVLFDIFRYLILGIGLCTPLIIAKYYSASSRSLIAVAVVVGIIYYLIIVYQDKQLQNGLLNLIKKFIP